MAVGHALADPTANSAGATYIVLGGPAISSPLNLATELDGTTGFVLQGSASGDKSGTSVANAGVRANGLLRRHSGRDICLHSNINRSSRLDYVVGDETDTHGTAPISALSFTCEIDHG